MLWESKKIQILLMAVALTACGSSKKPVTEKEYTLQAEAEEHVDNLDEAVSRAVLSKNKGAFAEGDASGEGSYIVDTNENGDETEVLAFTLYREYGFEDGCFVPVSGALRRVYMTFEKNDGYELNDYVYVDRSSGLTEKAVEGILKNFPEESVHTSLDDARKKEMIASADRYAEEFLKQTGRDEEFLSCEPEERVYLKDLGISEIAEHRIREDSAFKGFPHWIGSREVEENGERMLYVTDYDRDNNMILLTKYYKEDRVPIREYKMNGETGEITEE